VHTLNKQDLVDIVSQEAGTTKKDAEAIINSLMANIIKSVATGGKITLVGFGAFETRKYKARTGQNPRTGEPVAIPAKTKPAFKVGKDFAHEVQKKAK